MLQAFLYMLIRDYVVPGNVETIMRDLETAQRAGRMDSVSFTNTYAASLAERLEAK